MHVINSCVEYAKLIRQMPNMQSLRRCQTYQVYSLIPSRRPIFTIPSTLHCRLVLWLTSCLVVC